MNHFLRGLPVLFAVLLFGLPLLAQQQRVMTLDEIVAAGLQNSKQLQASAAKSAAAQIKTTQYKNAFIPSLSYTGAYLRVSDNIEPFAFTLPDGTEKVLNPVILNQYTNRLSVSEPVFTGFRALNTLHAAEFLARAAQLDVAKDRAEVQLNLLGAALNLYKLQAARRAFEQSLPAAQHRLAELQHQRDQGLALDNDVLRAELAVGRLENAREETDNALAAARFGLAVLTGQPESSLLVVDSASVFSGSPGVAALDTYLESAGQRADVQSAVNRAMAAGKQVNVSKGAYFPLVTLGANLYDNRPNQRVFPPEDRFKSTWDAGVTLSWNLSGLYTNRHNVEEAKLNQQQAQFFSDQLNEAARSDIANQFYQWKSAEGRIALAEKSLRQSLENRRVTEVRQQQQVASVTELLDADTEWVQAQINAISARADARLAYFRLLKSTGKL